MFLDAQWQLKIIDVINEANFTGNNDSWLKMGKYVGKIFASLLEFTVPSVEYIYGESVLEELRAQTAASS